MYCKGCHYPLLHVVPRRCPECGRQFDPENPTTFLEYAPLRAASRGKTLWIVSVSAIVLTIAWLLLAIWFFIESPLPLMGWSLTSRVAWAVIDALGVITPAVFLLVFGFLIGRWHAKP